MARRLALLVLLICACGNNGTDAHAGESSYVPTDRAYRLWYAAPPWQIVDMSMSDAPILSVMAVMSSPEVDSGVAGSLTALYVNVSTASPADLVAARLAQASAADETLIYAPRDVAVAGASATESAFDDGVLVHRFVAVALSDGRTVSLEFQSVDSIQNDPDVTTMIGQFEPRPPPVHP